MGSDHAEVFSRARKETGGDEAGDDDYDYDDFITDNIDHCCAEKHISHCSCCDDIRRSVIGADREYDRC